tara:strand:- start:7546 stop:9894 length:2349 start_codon:yes stop_codon:yes gene_type:complete
MGFREAWKSLFSSKQYSGYGQPVISYHQTGYNNRTKKDSYADLAKEGYVENAVAFRCVNEIANGACSVKFVLMRGEQPLEEHPILTLLQRPNPTCSQSEYFRDVYSYLLLAGNSYLLSIGEEGQEPKELHTLRPDRIQIKTSDGYYPEEYRYVIDGKVKAIYPVDQLNGRSELKHIKTFHPLDDHLGLSPIMPSATDIDQHNLTNRHNAHLLVNGARPSGAVIYKPKDEIGAMTTLTDAQREQLRVDLRQRFEGSENSGRTMILEGDFDYKEMGLSPKEMDFSTMKNMSARDIALTFGVPAQLVGIPDAQTYANMAEARLALYEETIIPLLQHIESDLNEWLVPMFGDDLTLKYDIDGIPAITERRRMITDNILRAVNEGVLTRNEARERLNLEPISGGDEVYIPSNLFPLGNPTPNPPQPLTGDDAEKIAEEYFNIKREVRKDVFTTESEAQARADELGCTGIHSHDTGNGTIYMPCGSHADYERITGEQLKQPPDPRMGEGDDIFDTVGEARARAEQIGCEGTHTLRTPDGNLYMPCSSHAIYLRETGNNKALSDINTTPTEGMADEAQRGLDWREEFGRGGTAVGLARARQLVRRDNLSISTVRRMFAFFSRHEVDKQAEGFNRGEKGYPSNGRIAWALWGGDAGFSWSTKKRAEILTEMEENKYVTGGYVDIDEEEEDMKKLSGRMAETIKNKVTEHNDKYGDDKGKRVNSRMLEAVFRRGVGAYRTNPESVRRTVLGPEQWGIARVNAFLYAVRRGRFRSGQFDRDLLPKDHPLSTR